MLEELVEVSNPSAALAMGSTFPIGSELRSRYTAIAAADTPEAALHRLSERLAGRKVLHLEVSREKRWTGYDLVVYRAIVERVAAGAVALPESVRAQ